MKILNGEKNFGHSSSFFLIKIKYIKKKNFALLSSFYNSFYKRVSHIVF